MQKLWPGISGMSHHDMSPTSIPMCLKTRQAHSFPWYWESFW